MYERLYQHHRLQEWRLLSIYKRVCCWYRLNELRSKLRELRQRKRRTSVRQWGLRVHYRGGLRCQYGLQHNYSRL